jgi:hypothetical protein
MNTTTAPRPWLGRPASEPGSAVPTTGCSPCWSVGAGYAFQRYQASMDGYEQAILLGSVPAAGGAGLVLGPAARAEPGRGRGQPAGHRAVQPPDRRLRRRPGARPSGVPAEVLLSSQSAILWMCVLFFMSTVFYWIGCFQGGQRPAGAHNTGRAHRPAGLALAWGRGDGPGGHDGALVREPPDRARHRPHPGEQPLRGVHHVLLDDGAVLPVLRAALPHRARWALS